MTDKFLAPMLAMDVKKLGNTPLNFPFIAQPKIDGFRGIVYNHKAYTRSGKEFTNRTIKSMAKELWLQWGKDFPIDGEFVVGQPWENDVFNKTQSLIGHEEVEDVHFWLFDYIDKKTSAEERHNNILKWMTTDHFLNFYYIETEYVVSPSQVDKLLDDFTDVGYEGLMLRQVDALYKNGRSGKRDQCLLKMKPKETSEAIIIDVIELENNLNTLEKSELGYAKRSTSKLGKEKANKLGAIVVECVDKKWENFNIGSGFDDEQREKLWGCRDSLIGKEIIYEYTNTGAINRPRSPVFKGFRQQWDK